MSIEQPGRYLRTNYRLTGGKVDLGALNSMLVLFNDLASMHGTYSAGNPVTISMVGYGYPQFVAVVGQSTPAGIEGSLPVVARATQSFSGSIGWVYVFQSDSNFANSINLNILALIGSR
ncbi:MAG: hypothetical protein JRD89_00640 [Deltaproteobacteria bacterium]|nr:hypothetical protein [Deltaproteobacteria bacterium]